MDAGDDASIPITDENHANGSDNQSLRRTIIKGDQLDIEAYDSLYSGRTKIMRLLFIADHFSDTNSTVQLEALRMAYDEIKKGENTQLLREVTQKIDGRLGPSYELDTAYCTAVDRRAEQKQEN